MSLKGGTLFIPSHDLHFRLKLLYLQCLTNWASHQGLELHMTTDRFACCLCQQGYMTGSVCLFVMITEGYKETGVKILPEMVPWPNKWFTFRVDLDVDVDSGIFEDDFYNPKLSIIQKLQDKNLTMKVVCCLSIKVVKRLQSSAKAEQS